MNFKQFKFDDIAKGLQEDIHAAATRRIDSERTNVAFIPGAMPSTDFHSYTVRACAKGISRRNTSDRSQALLKKPLEGPCQPMSRPSSTAGQPENECYPVVVHFK